MNILQTQQQSSTPTAPQTESTALSIVLQWLTYVFWFWTLGVLGTVISGVLIQIFVEEAREGTWIVYAAAPLIVLLPLATVADKYYKKIEPRHKHGFSAIIMVINAVIACLCAVGAVVAIVYSVLDLVLSTRSDTTGNLIAFLVALVVAGLSALFFVRVLYIEKFAFVRSRFALIVSIIAAVTLLAVIVFPLANEIRRKSDRIVEDNYSRVRSDINKYIRNEKNLPSSLNDVEFDDRAQDAIDTGKITYKTPNGLGSLNSNLSDSFSTEAFDIGSSSSISNRHTYELCVDWTHERNSRYESNYSSSNKGFSSYEGHEAGIQCYEESTTSY